MGLTLTSALGIVAAVATVTTVAIGFIGFVVSLRTKVESDRVVSPAILGAWVHKRKIKFKFREWRFETTVELPKLYLQWHILEPKFNWEYERPPSDPLTDKKLLTATGGDPRTACWISFVRDNATIGNPVILSTAIRRVVSAADITNGAPRMETTVGDLIRWCLLNGGRPDTITIKHPDNTDPLSGLYWVSGTLHTAAGTMTLSHPSSISGSTCVGHYQSNEGRTDAAHMASRAQVTPPNRPTQEWADLFLGTFRAYDGVATAAWRGLPAWRDLGIERHIAPEVTRHVSLDEAGPRGELCTSNNRNEAARDIATSLFISFTTSLAGAIVDGNTVTYPSGVGSARGEGPIRHWSRVRSWLETNVDVALKNVLDRLGQVSGAIHPLLRIQVPAVSLAFVHEVDILAREMVLGAGSNEQHRARWMHPTDADKQRIRLFDVVWNITAGTPKDLQLEEQLKMLRDLLQPPTFPSPVAADTFLVCKIIRFMSWYPAVDAMYDSTGLWNNRNALYMGVEVGFG